MATFKGSVKQCVVCSVQFKVPACRAATAICCSRKCKDVWWSLQKNKVAVFKCKQCGTAFEDFASHSDRRIFCSRACKAKSWMPDRLGENNSGWKGGKSLHEDGYVYVGVKNHPFAKSRYIFEHRLVMETWLREHASDSPYLVSVKGKKYLSPDVIVHHKNEIKTDNAITNLECMTQRDHLRHHRNTEQSLRKQIADLERKLALFKKET